MRCINQKLELELYMTEFEVTSATSIFGTYYPHVILVDQSFTPLLRFAASFSATRLPKSGTAVERLSKK